MKAKLSQELVDSLEPPGGESLLRVWDTLVPGFGVYVTANGTKAYFVAYRVGRRERRATLGKTPPLKCHRARENANRYLQDARSGIDPLAKKAEEQGRRTLRQFWPEFLADATSRWKPSTSAENRRLWEKIVEPRLGGRHLDSLTAGDVSAWHRALKKTPAQANMALRLVKSMLNRAVAWEYLLASPAANVPQYPEKKRERFLTAEEFAVLFEAIAAEEAIGGIKSIERVGEAEKGRRGGKGLKEPTSRGITPHSAALFRLLVFTGARLGEVMRSRWEWVHWDTRCLALPDSKTGARRVPLSAPALDELLRLQRIRTEGCGWVIEGAVPLAHLVNPEKPWQRVRDRAHAILNERRKKAKLPELEESTFTDLRIHDLRHSFASVAVAAGLGLPIVGKALGHRQARTTERYAHLGTDPVLEAADRIGAVIVEAVTKPQAVIEEVGNQ